MKTRETPECFAGRRRKSSVTASRIAPGMGMDGRKKDMKRRKKIPGLPENPRFLLEGAVLIGVIAYLFYDSPLAAVFLSPLLYPYYRRRAGEKRRQDKKELSAQFRERTGSPWRSCSRSLHRDGRSRRSANSRRSSRSPAGAEETSRRSWGVLRRSSGTVWRSIRRSTFC